MNDRINLKNRHNSTQTLDDLAQVLGDSFEGQFDNSSGPAAIRHRHPELTQARSEVDTQQRQAGQQ